ncbi:hypothetical protein [Gordonia aurantiaca]|uniref:hypothetical protein n=1 Tax=Gordonia sp. B21 TaxID=3151852 RepID=UPI0032674855
MPEEPAASEPDAGELPIEPAETGSPDPMPDDARRKVDELEEKIVDEPAEREPAAEPSHTEDDESDLRTPATGDPEPPD